MKDLAAIRKELASYNDAAALEAAQAGLASQIEQCDRGSELIEDVLRLFERFPEDDFGMPGALTHALERFFGERYVKELSHSLHRRPTPQTILMARRVLARDPSNHPTLWSALQKAGERSDIPPGISALARESSDQV